MTRGVSGGERKRTNIGVELIGNPSILFLDEPTSGLDAFQAFNVMQSLWHLAQAGRTVLATVHQPRSSIFQMFDLLMLITGGRMIYFGPAADAVQLVSIVLLLRCVSDNRPIKNNDARAFGSC